MHLLMARLKQRLKKYSMAKAKNTDINTTDNETLEVKLGRLDEIISALEGEDITLEDAFEQYSKGIRLVKECNDSIDRVEKKVKALMDNGELEDFE